MTVDGMDIEALSSKERIALMERLWESLEASGDLDDPPSWHEKVLADRAKEWEQRHEISQVWEQAKKISARPNSS